MAVSWTVVDLDPASVGPILGHLNARICSLTPSGTYSTGGDTLAAADFGMTTLLMVIPAGYTSQGFLAKYLHGSTKLQLFYGAVGALVEIPNATAVTGDLRVLVIGV